MRRGRMETRRHVAIGATVTHDCIPVVEQSMKVIVDAAVQSTYRPEHFVVRGVRRPSPETPERLERLLAAAEAAGHAIGAPEAHGPDPVLAVHGPDFVHFLQTIHAQWSDLDGASPAVVPNVHPLGRPGGYPRAPVGLAGYHLYDTAAPIDAQTWPAAAASANVAAHAAVLVRDGAEQTTYALCRPPGHHAGRDVAGGFCFLNNAAIAAQALRTRHERVAVLDVDLHHGNGTQAIFYARRDVLTVSLHADPALFYPFFWGYAHERGEGPGAGFNLNLPLPLGTGDDGFQAALATAVDHVAGFRPGALVVALGLDAYAGDPFGGLAVSTIGFGRIGHAIGALRLPTVLVQEGGYACDALGDNLVRFLDGFAQGHAEPAIDRERGL